MSKRLDREVDEKSVSEKIEEELKKLRRKAKALGYKLVKEERPVKYTEEQIGALLDRFRSIFTEIKGEPPSLEREAKAGERISEMEQSGFSIERAFKEIEKFAREQAAIRTLDEAAQIAEEIKDLFASQYRSLLHEDPPVDLSQLVYTTAKRMYLEGKSHPEIVEWMEGRVDKIVREKARAERATRARGALAGYVERLEQLTFGGVQLGPFRLMQRVRIKETGQVGQIEDGQYDKKEGKWVYRVVVRYDPYNPFAGLSLFHTEDELEPV